MRAVVLAFLGGCTAQAGAPISGGGGLTAAQVAAIVAGNTVTDSTLAQCQALTPAEGDTCYPTDSIYTLISRAAGTWSYRHPAVGFDVTPPPSAGWTAYNSGAVTARGGRRFLAVPAGALAWFGEYRDDGYVAGTDSFYVEWCVSDVNGANGSTNYAQPGGTAVGFMEDSGNPSGGDNLIVYHRSGHQRHYTTYSAPGTYAGPDYVFDELPPPPTRCICWTLEADDRTLYELDSSRNATLIGVDTTDWNANVTPANVWWGAQSFGSAGVNKLELWHLKTGAGIVCGA